MVIQFGLGWLSKSGQLQAGRIRSKTQSLDCTILPTGIGRLKNNEQTSLVFGVQFFLELIYLFA